MREGCRHVTIHGVVPYIAILLPASGKYARYHFFFNSKFSFRIKTELLFSLYRALALPVIEKRLPKNVYPVQVAGINEYLKTKKTPDFYRPARIVQLKSSTWAD